MAGDMNFSIKSFIKMLTSRQEVKVRFGNDSSAVDRMKSQFFYNTICHKAEKQPYGPLCTSWELTSAFCLNRTRLGGIQVSPISNRTVKETAERYTYRIAYKSFSSCGPPKPLSCSDFIKIRVRLSCCFQKRRNGRADW